MKNLSPQAELANRVVSQGRDEGLGHLKVDEILDKGRTVIVNGRKLVNFSNCSYLGLEFDPRILNSAKDAIDKYGISFSSSRSFLELSLFEELEGLLGKIFNKPTIFSQSTTLGHIAVIPLVVGNNDAVILDHRVHNSISNAVSMVKSRGVYVETIRHNNLDFLESRIKKLEDKYDKIWYMADGVYSMLGDVAPLKEINQLLNRYEKFYFYVDDAHGMSWTGKNGCGYVLENTSYHEKMILITSLGKGFGSLGGALIMPDSKTKEVIRNIGSTLMFSIQPQPVTLAAAIASAHIHLSDSITILQDKIKLNMSHFILIAKALKLPLISDAKTPIFYIEIGNPDTTFKISKRLIRSGFFINSVVYPAVPHKNTGLRITVTANHTYQDIYEMLNIIADEFDLSPAKKSKNVEENALLSLATAH
jgi:7-keto-8-aminopelargonate synthetase-like enzyme